MLVLSDTSDVVEAVLNGAHTTNPLRCVAMWRDITTTTYTAGRTVINTNGASDVTIVGSPGSSTQRVVDFISIFNSDTTSKTVTIKLQISGPTEYILSQVTLAPGERLEYTDAKGFAVYTVDGALKTSVNQGTNSPITGYSRAVLSADRTNNNGTANTIADVTGLSVPVTNGQRMWFRFVIRYTAAATTTGSRWSINGPTNTELIYASKYSLTTTSATFNEGLTAYDLPAASNATSAATAGNLAIIEGIILPSANGNVIARFASEVSASAIVAKAGSFVDYGVI